MIGAPDSSWALLLTGPEQQKEHRCSSQKRHAAQWVKRLLNKQDNRSLAPSLPQARSEQTDQPVTLGLGKAETGGPLGQRAQGTMRGPISRDQERKPQRKTPNILLWPICIHMSTHTHMYPHIHTPRTQKENLINQFYF